ncbi:DUF5675 family protein [Ornithobacterium rhinotracheale]|uniref:DUF5675 family protein n=1 Tax=Ornithobacterium rhinotracheale TaxID=28251 RepID=UPI003FA4BEE9
MRHKKLKLALSELEKEMEVISNEEMRSFKGGGDPVIISIYRIYDGNDSTISYYEIDGIKGWILEPAGPSTSNSGMDRRIPPGDYKLNYHPTNKGDYELYNDNVSTYRHIKIHPGNTGADTEGCLLPGSSADLKSEIVYGSRKEYQRLKEYIERVGAENVTIRIIEK